ncbi:DNA repair and recombination protein RAD52 [Blastomyces parvus]|uniref:RAD52 homolog n=1 Tax=Blastomyces parvus TaxID=2060905 RepID=A0A2B7XFI8_9EURO|nr:DNA repair and recombination protein RAD52 [Blastomyces parvus]
MPAPESVGDQHRPRPAGMTPTNFGNAVTKNPFETSEHRLNQYTAQEIATLQSRLEKRLGPEYISSRQGPGGQRVHYLAAEKCINLANEVFGFNGWSSSIQNIEVDYVDENPNTGKISLGVTVIVRVTLRDGAFHEDLGYGHCENSKSKALAFEKAKKEGTTDALKRALRTFGNVLGNCVYDKEYLSRVTKVKAAPTKWDVGDLHRDASHTVVKKEPNPIPNGISNPPNPASTGLPPRLHKVPSGKADESLPLDLEGEFGSDLFDEADFAESHSEHPDEVVIDQQPEPPQQNLQQAYSISHELQNNRPGAPTRHMNQAVTPSKPENSWPTGAPIRVQPDLPPISGERLNRPLPPQLSSNHPLPANLKTPTAPRPQQLLQSTSNPVPPQPPKQTANLPPPLPCDQLKPKSELIPKDNSKVSPSRAPSPFNSQIPEDKRPQDPVGGFYSARAADKLRSNPYEAPKSAPAFDPRFDSPSIRKTAGINHNASAPVIRTVIGINPPRFTNDTPGSIPSASQVQYANLTKTNVPDSTKRGPVPRPVGGSGNGFVPPAARSPMTTSSYRPPTRMTRSNAAQVSALSNTMTAPAQAQNANGKRPPLTDVTNGQGSEDSANDPTKKTRVDNVENISNTTTQQQQQQQQQQQRQ